jgi:hypothetical protein
MEVGRQGNWRNRARPELFAQIAARSLKAFDCGDGGERLAGARPRLSNTARCTGADANGRSGGVDFARWPLAAAGGWRAAPRRKELAASRHLPARPGDAAGLVHALSLACRELTTPGHLRALLDAA